MVYSLKVTVFSFMAFFKETIILNQYLFVYYYAFFEKAFIFLFSLIGTIGFFACFWFVTKIYSVVKVD